MSKRASVIPTDEMDRIIVRVYSGQRVAMAVEKLQEQKDAWRSNPIEEHYGISGER